jgi:hypothetical protein
MLTLVLKTTGRLRLRRLCAPSPPHCNALHSCAQSEGIFGSIGSAFARAPQQVNVQPPTHDYNTPNGKHSQPPLRTHSSMHCHLHHWHFSPSRGVAARDVNSRLRCAQLPRSVVHVRRCCVRVKRGKRTGAGVTTREMFERDRIWGQWVRGFRFRVWRG